MRFVIMANGQGLRWGNYQGIPKQLLEVNGETLLQRTTRLVLEADPDAEVIISSSNPQCVAAGARRYEPLRNELEIDRFVPELVADGMCFLYGDTFYTSETIRSVFRLACSELLFFGNEKTIFAVKVGKAWAMHRYFDEVRESFLQGRLEACKGWQVYYAYAQGEYGWAPSASQRTGPDFVHVRDRTGDFNTPQDWQQFRQGTVSHGVYGT